MLGAVNKNSLDQQFALDVNAVKQLQQTARSNPNQALATAAKEFEAIFIQMMLKSMRDASFKSELLQSHQNDFYTSLFDQQISKSMAGKGVGLADLMVAQLSKQTPQDTSALNLTAEQQSALNNYTAAQLQDTLQSSVPYSAHAPALTNHYSSTESGTPKTASAQNLPVEGFVDEVMDHAVKVSKQTGIPAGFSIAHAALESGWGRSVPHFADGKSSFNLFGIKAGKDWNGKVIEVTTTEYSHGVAQKVVDRFKAYDSYSDAFLDYAKLLSQNERYASVMKNAHSAKGYAVSLQTSGYATDPNYARKLYGVMQQMGIV